MDISEFSLVACYKKDINILRQIEVHFKLSTLMHDILHHQMITVMFTLISLNLQFNCRNKGNEKQIN